MSEATIYLVIFLSAIFFAVVLLPPEAHGDLYDDQAQGSKAANPKTTDPA